MAHALSHAVQANASPRQGSGADERQYLVTAISLPDHILYPTPADTGT